MCVAIGVTTQEPRRPRKFIGLVPTASALNVRIRSLALARDQGCIFNLCALCASLRQEVINERNVREHVMYLSALAQRAIACGNVRLRLR